MNPQPNILPNLPSWLTLFEYLRQHGPVETVQHAAAVAWQFRFLGALLIVLLLSNGLRALPGGDR